MYDAVIPDIIKLAQENPKLNIHMGGPYFAHYGFKRNDIPNLIGYGQKTVYELFDFPFNENDWHFKVPEGFDHLPINYTYPRQVGYGCRWGQCTFCKQNHAARTYHYDIRELNRIPIVDHPKDKYIWIHNSSPLPQEILATLLLLPDREDLYIGSYLRGDKKIYKSLKEGFSKTKYDTSHLHISLGVEIPSDRLLRYIKKGTSRKWLAENIKLMDKNNVKIHMNLMGGFGNITKEDVDEIIKFWEDLKSEGVRLDKAHATLIRLVILHDRTMYKDPPGPLIRFKEWKTYKDLPRTKDQTDDEIRVYYCDLNDEALELNNIIYEYYKNHAGFGYFVDFYNINKFGRATPQQQKFIENYLQCSKKEQEK
jgi:radical SAM superfamily enzyme YgiQ (UPF0313 family)